MREDLGPIAGVNYPRSLEEFDEFFPDEASCRRYLTQLRWPNGYECHMCESRELPWITGRGYLHCRNCECEISITSGTVFERTRTPLRSWFLAIWFLTSQKYGASAMGLQRVIGLGSYHTAWTCLHKLRRAMVSPQRKLLSGPVEVDEAYVGGTDRGGKRGRGSQGKDIVVIAVEIRSPKGFGRIRMQCIPDVSGESLIPFIRGVVEPGSEILTDGWSGYNELPKHGFTRNMTVVSNSGDPAHVTMPGVHRIASLLKRWLLGTHQGAVSTKHLDYYLDEFTFRFNRRTSKSRGLLFFRLMQHVAATAPTSYQQIVVPNHNI